MLDKLCVFYLYADLKLLMNKNALGFPDFHLMTGVECKFQCYGGWWRRGVAAVKRWQVSSKPQRVKLPGKNKGKLGETEKDCYYLNIHICVQ